MKILPSLIARPLEYALPTKLLTGAGVIASHVTAPVGRALDLLRAPENSRVRTHTTMDSAGVAVVTVDVKVPCAPEKVDALARAMTELASPASWSDWFGPFKGSRMVDAEGKPVTPDAHGTWTAQLEETMGLKVAGVSAEVWNTIRFDSEPKAARQPGGGELVHEWNYALTRTGGLRLLEWDATRQAQGVTIDEGSIQIIKHKDGVEMRGLKRLAFDPKSEGGSLGKRLVSAALNNVMDFNTPWLTEQFLRQMGNDIQKAAAAKLAAGA